MDIATLGVAVDPTKAQAGSKAVTSALTEMSAKSKEAVKGVETAVNQAGESVKKLATTAKAAGTQTEQSLAKAARTPAFDQLKAKAVSTGRAMQQALTIQTTASPWQKLLAGAQQAASGVQGAFSTMAARVATSVTGTFNKMKLGAQMFGASIATSASSGWSRLTSAASSAATSVVGSFGRMRNAVSQFRGSSASIVDVANTLGLLNNPLGNAISRFDSLRRIMGGMPALAGPIVATLGTLAGAFMAVTAAVNLTWSAMSNAGPIQQAQTGLTAVTGSAKQADAMLTALRTNAKATGADLSSSLSTSLKFTALGFSPADAVKMNKSISDIAGTLGMSKAAANELGNALAQVQSKGVVSMEELRQQIAEKGVPVFDELAKKLKVSTGELIKMVGEGKVQSKSLIDIFLNLEGGFQKFAGGSQKATAQMPGAIARVEATWNDLLITMGKPINDAITPLLNTLAERMGGLENVGQAMGEGIASAIKTVGPLLDGFVTTAFGKVQGLLAMIQSSDGLGVSWARNTWITFVEYGLQAVQKITAAFGTLGEYLLARFADVVETFAIVTTPEFWSRMGTALDVIALDFQSALIIAAQGFLNLIIDHAPAWLTGGNSARADFSGLVEANNRAAKVKTDMPRADLVAPDIVNLNNGDTSLGGIWDRQNANTGKIFQPTIDSWKQYGKDKATAAAAPWQAPSANGEALSTKGSSSSAAATADKASKATEKAMKKLQQTAQKYIEATQTPMEKYAATIKEIDMLTQKGLLTAEQAKRAREQAAKDMRANEQSWGTPLQQLTAQWRDLTGQMQQASANVAQSISGNIGNGLGDIITGTKSASQAFSDMGKSIVNDLARIATQMLINYAIQKAIGFAVGAISGTGGATTATATATSATTASVHHSGGMIGGSGPTRTVDSSAFANAPRFQHGGVVPGLSSGETPVIAERGETMLNRDQAEDIRRRLGTSKKKGNAPAQQMAVTVINVQDPSTLDAHMMRNPNGVLNVLGANASKARRMMNLAPS